MARNRPAAGTARRKMERMAATGRLRLRWLWVVTLLGIALLIAACSSENGDPGDGGSAAAEPTSSGASGDGGPDGVVLDPGCEELGYPCSLAETPPELIERTQDLLTAATEEFATNGAAGAIEFLLAEPDVLDVFGDAEAITFRIQGAPPAWLVNQTGVGGDRSAASRSSTAGPAPTGRITGPTMQPISVVGEDTTGDGAVDNRDAKRALVLAPYHWQFAPDDESDLLAERLEALAPYEGNVTLHVNRNRGDQVVTAADFQELDRYDAIFIATHGFRTCPEVDGTQCRTIVLTGVRLNQFDMLSSGTLSGFAIIAVFDADTPTSSADFEIGVDTHFFRRNFPNGLDDTLLFLSACQTGSIAGDELAAAAGGENFVMMAWTESVPTDGAFNAAGVFIEQLSLGLSSELAYQGVIEAGFASADNGDGITALEHISPRGNAVRLLELPTLLFEGLPMRDGSNISDLVDGTPGDDAPDTLELNLRLIGIDDPSRYQVIYEVNGQRALGSYGLSNATAGTLPYEVSVSHEVNLGFDLPTGDISVSAIVQLPEGGESRYAANVTVGGEALAVITVGGETWRFEGEGLVGCSLSDDGSQLTAGGTVDGALEVWFSAQLTPVGIGTGERLVVGNLARIQVKDGLTHQTWAADPLDSTTAAYAAIPGGSSQIDSLTIEGSHAWGTATFIEMGAVYKAWSDHIPLPSPVTGSFDIECGSGTTIYGF